jgi:signal transduction histidine kinase
VSAPPADSLLDPLLERATVAIGILDAGQRYLYVNRPLADINGVSVEDHLGRTLHEVIPHIADQVAGFHEQVMSTGTALRDVQVRGSTPGRPDSIWQVSYFPLELDGGPAVGAVLLDVTSREQAMAETQRRVRQHAAVADLGQRALSGLAIDDLMETITDRLRRELDAEMAGVLKFAPDREQLIMCSGAGFPEGAVGRLTADLGRRSQAGYTLMTGGTVLTRDLDTEDRFEISPGMRAQGARSTISTPIPGADEPYGVLGVFSLRPNHFDEDDAGFVRAVANVLGHAVVRDEQSRVVAEMSGQRGRLVAQALEAGEREQRQVADVLHDDVLQHLLFARQELSDAGSGDAAVDRARASVEEAAGLLRRVVAGLHPVTLSHAGLAAALKQLAGEHHARGRVRAEVQVEPAAEGVHDRLVVSLVRELLTNVAKHSGAERAVVEVTTAGRGLCITVADDGRGMPGDAIESALAGGKIGLAAARERVEALGGSARVRSGIGGRGTAVEIRLPR